MGWCRRLTEKRLFYPSVRGILQMLQNGFFFAKCSDFTDSLLRCSMLSQRLHEKKKCMINLFQLKLTLGHLNKEKMSIYRVIRENTKIVSGRSFSGAVLGVLNGVYACWMLRTSSRL